MTWDKITEKLRSYNLDRLAIEKLFIIRPPQKIYPMDFVKSFYKLMHEGEYSVDEWAATLGSLIGKKVSSMGIFKKLQFRHIAFAKSLMEEAISKEMVLGKKDKNLASKLFVSFRKVLVEDSSCFSLPSNLANFFPSSFSKNGETATAKIQYRMDLKTDGYEDLKVGNFRDSDGLHAPEIVKDLKKGDLVIRDLGYWKTAVFRKIAEKGSFFLSVYKKNTYLFSKKGKKEGAIAGKKSFSFFFFFLFFLQQL